ncbi:HIT family protein [Furfurilactobacillus sp. WILCCON 0119]
MNLTQKPGCPFCEKTDIIIENDLAKAFWDIHPVNPGHTLIVPKRHVTDWWGLTNEEKAAIDELVVAMKAQLDDQYHPDAYNIGMNLGADAGQTVFHAHVHLIPRYEGDMKVPSGGVRNLIPRKVPRK